MQQPCGSSTDKRGIHTPLFSHHVRLHFDGHAAVVSNLSQSRKCLSCEYGIFFPSVFVIHESTSSYKALQFLGAKNPTPSENVARLTESAPISYSSTFHTNLQVNHENVSRVLIRKRYTNCTNCCILFDVYRIAIQVTFSLKECNEE